MDGESVGYICRSCADRLGATWPLNHCATGHMGICPECKQEAGLCSVDDWDWAGDAIRNKPKYSGGRD